MSDTLDRTAATNGNAADSLQADLADIGSRIESEVRRLRRAALDEARSWANDVGIREARESVPRALDAHRAAQATYRKAQTDEADAQESFDGAVSEAEWGLGGSFVVEANKTFLLYKEGDGDEEAIGRRQMTADEKRAWIAENARKQPGVKAVEAELRKAREATLTARDDLTHSELRVKAASGDRDAAAAELMFLAAALPRKELT